MYEGPSVLNVNTDKYKHFSIYTLVVITTLRQRPRRRFPKPGPHYQGSNFFSELEKNIQGSPVIDDLLKDSGK